jgi:hypothetical protein
MNGWFDNLVQTILNALTAATLAALDWALGLLAGSVFSSPDVTVLPQVSYVSGRAQLVANAAMVLIVVVVGILAMTNGGAQERYALKDLLPRMLTGFLAANLAVPVVRAAIGAANTLTEALTGQPSTAHGSFNQLRTVIVGASRDEAMLLLVLVMSLLALWMLIMLIVTWLGRLTVLLIVAATGPVALLCHALPQTDPVARLWWRSLVGALAVQVLQAVTLNVAVATLLASDANLPALGLPNDPLGLFNLLITCFVLWLVIRIPTWVARNFGGNASRVGAVLGGVVRVVLVQQVLSAVGLRGGRLLRRAGSSGPRPPATHLHSHHHTGSHQHQHVHVHPPRPSRAPGPAGQAPRRVPSWVGQPARPHPGRPPQALEHRPALPAPPRRVTGNH